MYGELRAPAIPEPTEAAPITPASSMAPEATAEPDARSDETAEPGSIAEPDTAPAFAPSTAPRSVACDMPVATKLTNMTINADFIFKYVRSTQVLYFPVLYSLEYEAESLMRYAHCFLRDAFS